jgi:hypothetical protein
MILLNSSPIDREISPGIITACSTADRSNELQAARGEMFGAGRQQASAIKVQFGSIGPGSDATGIESLRRFFAYAKQQAVLDSVQKRAWGREGEINFCALFRDSQAHFWQLVKKRQGERCFCSLSYNRSCLPRNPSTRIISAMMAFNNVAQTSSGISRTARRLWRNFA